jgi:hypothetical protein
MVMTTTSAQTSSVAGSLPATGSSNSNSIAIHLDRNNFLLWKTLVIPHLAGQGYLGYIDGSLPVPPKTITTGTGADAITTTNPEYTNWWHTDQRIMSVLLRSMTEDVLTQMIGRTTSICVWGCITSMFSTQGRASVRAYRRKLATMKWNDMSTSDYFNLMKGFADAMATVGAPLPNDELIDYILAGLGKEFLVLQASLNVFSNANPTTVILLTDFYSMLMSHEAMQDTVKIDFSSLANVARRGKQGGSRFGGG